MPTNIPGLASYPDFFAASLIVIITILLIIGVTESSLLNSIFTLTITVLFVEHQYVIKMKKKNFKNLFISTKNPF
jgi:hypothetical protein